MPSDDFKAPKTLKEGQERLAKVRENVNTVLDEAHDKENDTYEYGKVKSIEGGIERVAEVQAGRLTEIADLHEWVHDQEQKAELHKRTDEELKAGIKRPEMPESKDDRGEEFKARPLGEIFMRTKGAAEGMQLALKESRPFKVELGIGWKELKTTFERGAGFAPESVRTGRIEFDPQRPAPHVANSIPTSPTSSAAVLWMLETTYTNTAAERDEAAAYAEATIAYTQQTSTVQSIGVSLPVTDEQLEDEQGVEALLNNRLSNMVAQRLDSQILVGDGSSPNLDGTLNVSGINSQAKGADPTPDAVLKGIDLCRTVGFAEPNVMFAHPTDWQAVRLLRTADGVYIWGPPSQAGPDMIWGIPVVKTTAETQNTMVVGDYATYSELRVRKGMTVEIGLDGDDFTKGIRTIRAGIRVALIHYRPSAFAEITGV